MVFTNVMNPRSHVSRQERVPAHARAARRVDRRQRDDRLRRHARRVRVRRRRRGRDEGRAAVRAHGRRAGAAHRLDVPVRRAAARLAASGRCAACGTDVRAARRRDRAGRRRALTAGAATMTPNAIFRVALVGCGRISQNHFDALATSRRPDARRRVRHRRRARARRPAKRRASRRSRRSTRCCATRHVRRRDDLHAVRPARRAGRRRGAGGQARRHREADGDLARAGRRARARLRRRPASSSSS